MLNKLLLLASAVCMAGCAAKKQVAIIRKADTSVAVKAVKNNLQPDQLNAINLKQVDFNTFSGKARTKLAIDSQTQDVTLNIRIQKGRQIWVSVTAVVGIEVARALITPDSIKIINRLETTYIKKPFAYIYNYTSTTVNFNTLQSLFVGNAIPGLLSDSAIVKTDNGSLHLTGNLSDLTYELVLGPDLKVSTTTLTNPQTSQWLQVDNNNFVQSASRVIPSKIKLNSAAPKKRMLVELSYIKTDFDQPLEFPFTVPARFSVVN